MHQNYIMRQTPIMAKACRTCYNGLSCCFGLWDHNRNLVYLLETVRNYSRVTLIYGWIKRLWVHLLLCFSKAHSNNFCEKRSDLKRKWCNSLCFNFKHSLKVWRQAAEWVSSVNILLIKHYARYYLICTYFNVTFRRFNNNGIGGNAKSERSRV